MPPAPPISANGPSRLSSPAYSARSDSSTIRRAWSMSELACLTPTTLSIRPSSTSRSGSRLITRAAGDVVEQHRQVAGGRGDGAEVRHAARAGSACCSRASRPARRPRRAPPPACVRCTECAVSFEPVPATTVARSADLVHRRSRTAAASRRRRGSAASPVVPRPRPAVGAVLDEMAREAARGVLAHGAVGVERRHHRGQDRAEVGGGGHPRRLFHLGPAARRVG